MVSSERLALELKEYRKRIRKLKESGIKSIRDGMR